MTPIKLAEMGLVPEIVIRKGIRSLLRKRIDNERNKSDEERETFFSELEQSPLATHTEDANLQHYEVPSEFFLLSLGRRLKYSCGYWPEGVNTLDESEIAALKLVEERADLKDGQDVLDLGCGWGSFTLWAAERFPNTRITSVSNSAVQRAYIEQRAKELGLSNLTVITADMNHLELDDRFDRIVSIEMFEHMSNYRSLFNKISNWIKPDGKMFVHVFSHRDLAYQFEVKSDNDWMSQFFFTGGMMPSQNLLPSYAKEFEVERQWNLNGRHYQKTADAWLQKIDENREEIDAIFQKHYGKQDCALWRRRWRIFMMSCSELFGYRNGTEWGVSHYLFRLKK